MTSPPLPSTVFIPGLPSGWFPHSYTALAGNRLAILGTDIDFNSAFEKEDVSPWKLFAKASARIWIFDGEALSEEISFPLLWRGPVIDQFPDGRWLVASRRSGGDGDVRIIRADGTEERRIELGDGINHIKIDEKNRIWVGWFDEGVFGNDDWKYPGLKWPPSSNGIAAFNDRGELIQNASLSSIADCYALNIFGDEAWACTYLDFPIWQMKDGQETTWPSNLLGIRAIAVRYPFVLAAGGYGENTDSMVLVELTKDKAIEKLRWKTELMFNRQDCQLFDGRENFIHIVIDNKWHRWDVNEFFTKPD